MENQKLSKLVTSFNEWLSYKNLNELFENTYYKYEEINEALKSSMLRDIVKQIKAENRTLDSVLYKRLGGSEAFSIDKVTDDDIVEIDLSLARRKQHQNDLLMWFKAGKFLAFSLNGYPLNYYYSWSSGRRGRNYRESFKNTLALQREADKVFAIPEETLKEYGVKDLVLSRWNDKRNALALKSNVEFKQENMERYRKIMLEKELSVKGGKIETMMKKLMFAYAEFFEGNTGELGWSKINGFNKDIQKSLEAYKEYLWAKEHRGTYTNKEILEEAEAQIINYYNKYEKDLDLSLLKVPNN